MANGFNTSPFVLPQMFDKPGDALQQGLLNKERRDQRQFEINYRLQKEKEADDWRKLNLIQDLTNIDKYQTGEAVADAIGHQKAQDLFQKYTAMAGSLSPAELQYKISQDIGKTTLGMQSMKDELVQSDAMIKQLKQLHPALDSQKLTQDYRADVLNRRIEGNDFANPLKANNPSTIDLTNPDTLSDYIDVNKGLREAVVNPKNIQKDIPVLTGSPSTYTKFTGSLPFYMKENFDRQKDFAGGFYTGKQEPTMSLKTSVIPQGAFSGTDKPIEVLDKGAYDTLKSEGADVEPALRKLAKTKYSNYGQMSNDEKEIAMRDVAKDFITPFTSMYQFRAETATKPPHYSQTTINKFGGGEAITNDLYGRISDRVEKYAKDGFYTRGNALKGDELAAIRQATGDNKLEVGDFFLAKNDEGIGVYKVDNGEMHPVEANLITTLPKIKTNTAVAAGVPEKRIIAKQGENTKPSSEYTNITETNKGTIGIKNGKWYDIKTGKPIQ